MSDTVLGRGVIEVSADASKLKAGINDSKTSLESLRATAKSVGESLNQQSITYIRSLEKQAVTIDKQAANFGKSRSEIAAYNAAQMGVSQTASSLVTSIGLSEKSLIAQAAAARQAADATARLAEQQKFLDSIASKAKPPSNAFDAASQQGAALGINAEQLNPLIAKWRAVENSALEAAAAERQAADASGFISRLQGQVSSIGKTNAELLEMKAAQLGVAAQAGPLIAQLRAQEQGLNKVGVSSKMAAFQTQQLGFQLHDFAVQVISGQSPITAFVQQGSQLSGTFGGAGNAFRAVMGLLTPMRLAFGGIAGAVAGLGYAMYEGAKQSKEFADSLVLTGNYAGLTEGKFNDLAHTISASGQVGIHSVREFAQALVSTGQVGPGVFEKAAEAAARYGDATGKTAQEVAKDFASMSQGAAKWATEHNRSLNFLSAAQIELIKGFEEAGRAADAQGVIYDALNGRLRKLEPNLGALDRALRATSNGWHAFWDAAFDIDRTETIEDKLAALDKRIAAAKTPLGANPTAGSLFDRREMDANINERNGLLRERGTQLAATAAAAATAEINKNGIDANGFIDGYLKRAKSVEVLNKTLDEAKRKFAAAALAGTPVSAKNQAEVLGQIRKDFTPAKGPKSGIGNAQLSLDLEDIRNRSEALTNTYGNAEKTMEAMRSAGLVDEREYYAAKLAFLNLNNQAQEDALKQEITRLQAEKLSGKDKLDNLRKIAEAQAKLDKVRENAATSTEVLKIQETAALKAIERAYVDAEAAAKSYLDTISRAAQAEIDGAGKGTKAREFTSGTSAINEKFESKRQDLQRDNRNGKFIGRADDFARELALLNSSQAAEIAIYTAKYDKLDELQKDWSIGATEAMANYMSDAGDIAKQSEKVFTDAFQSMEDALVNFTRTGKLDFRSLADSIITDMARIAIKQQIASAMSSSGGSGGWLGMIAGLFGGGGSSTIPMQAGGGYKVGGVVTGPGSGTSDSINAWLSNGEHVTRAEQTKKWLPLLEAINSGEIDRMPVKKFANGGLVSNFSNSASAQQFLSPPSATQNASGATGGDTHITVQVTPPAGSSSATAQQWGATAGRQIRRATARNS